MKDKWLWVIAIALITIACVSSTLTKQNQEDVATLGDEILKTDPTLQPGVDQSNADAAELTKAASKPNQVFNLGVDSELAQRNYDNVKSMAAKVDTTNKEAVAIANRALVNAAKIAGITLTQRDLIKATEGVPWLGYLIAGLKVIGEGVGVAYGSTRGWKHALNWWRTPWGEKSPSEVIVKPAA